MNRTLTLTIASAFIAFTMLAGCSKKTTKIQPATIEKPPVSTTEPKAPLEPDFRDNSGDQRTRSVLIPVYFEYDRYELRPEAIQTLEKIGRLMKENSAIRLMAEGHADERGSSEYNMGLGENRARAVRKWLTSYGISGNRIETTSYGKEKPAVFSCDDESCHGQNRRVEWRLLAGEELSANW